MGLFDYFRWGTRRRVEKAFDEVKGMLDQGRVMFEAATAHLLDNVPLTVDLHALDKTINEGEQNVRRTVREHLGTDPEHDLVFSLKLTSIVQEAERIGDLAKTLAGVAELADGPRTGPLAESLRLLRDRLLVGFDLTRAGFVGEDEAAARQMMREHETLKREVAEYLRALTERDDITPAEGVVYALTARLLSRVSAHLANIVSTVVAPFDQMRRASTWPEGMPNA